MPDLKSSAPANSDVPVVAPYQSVATGGRRAARRASGYRSPRGVGDWLIATLAVRVGISGLSIFLYSHIAASVETALRTNRAAVSTVAFQGLSEQFLTSSRCLYGLTLLALVLLSCWFYRVVANLPHLNARDSRFSPGWAVAFLFIPLACLLYPFNILKEVWQGSDPEHALEDGYSWRRNRVTALIGVWWSAHLIVNALSGLTLGIMSGLAHRDLSEWEAIFRWLSIVRGAEVIEHLLLIALAVRLDARQDRRRQRLVAMRESRADAGPVAALVPSPALPAAVAGIALVGMALLIGLPVPVSSSASVLGWRTFTAPDDSFTVDMPGQAAEPAAYASSERVRYYTFQNDTSAFTVMELSVGGDPHPADDFLRAHLKKAVALLKIPNHETTVVKTTFLTQPDGSLGLEALFTRDRDEWQGTARFFLKGGILYEVVDTQRDVTSGESASHHFQASFHLR